MELVGREALTFELAGEIPRAAAARLLTGSGLEPELVGTDRARVHLLAFQMQELRPRGLPAWLGSDYGEALWRLGVRWEGRAAWLAVSCDLDRPHVRTLGARLVRYPVVAGEIRLEATGDGARLEVTAAGEPFVATAAALEVMPDAEAPRPALVRQAGALWQIPWAEDPAPWRRLATVQVGADGRARSALGLLPDEPLVWEATGQLQRGRTHRCGVALRIE